MIKAAMSERPAQLNCGGRILDLSRPHIMGILNVTPDSFSDGGRYTDSADGNAVSVDKVLLTVETMIADGATLIDVGGESTRPGAPVVGLQQEMDRVLPVVEAITAAFPVVVSVDTSTPELMTAAAKAGAGLINDVRSLQREGAMAAAKAANLPICLMHMQGDPQTMQQQPHYQDVTAEVAHYLADQVGACLKAGIAAHNLLVDPGFGFGKSLEHNLVLLNKLEVIANMGLPLLVGMSRKSMIGQVLEKPLQERLYGGLAVAVMAVMKGAHIIRCHDVAATADAVKMTAAVLAQGKE